MPAKQITDSANISSLDFHREFDVPNLQLTLDLSPSVWIGSGYNNVLGAKFTVTSPFGQVLPNPTSATYDLTPPDMETGEVVFTLPSSFSAVEWGVYQIQVVLTDGDGDTYTLSKSFDLCRPKQTGKEVNTSNASMLLTLDIKIRDGLGTAYDQTVYAYKTVEASEKSYNNSIYYDATLGLPTITSTAQPPIQFNLYTGKITYSASNVVTYEFPDELTVILKYVGTTSKEVTTIDFCKAYCCLKDAYTQSQQYAGTTQGVNLMDKFKQGSALVLEMQLGIDCGYDIASMIEAFHDLLNCDCSCDCNGAIQPEPGQLYSQSVVIQGAGNNTVSQSTAGTTTTYVVNGKTYSVVYGGSQATPEIIINRTTVGNAVIDSVSINIPQLATYLQQYLSIGGVLHDDSTDTYIPNNTSENTLKSYTLPAKTGDNTPFNTLSKDGDVLEIETMMQDQLTSSGNLRTIRFKFGGVLFYTIFANSGTQENISVIVKMHRKSDAEIFYTIHTTRGIVSWSTVGTFGTLTPNLLVANIISITGQNDSAVANSFLVKNLTVTLTKKA